MKKWKKMLLAGALSLGLAIPGAVMTGCLGLGGESNVDLRVQNGYVQFYDGEEWKNLIAVEELKGDDGDDGQDGQDGVKGQDGREVEFRTTTTHIQWRYKGSSETWKNLVELSALKGPAGSTGATGAPGKDGQDGEDGISTYVHIRYSDSKPTQNSDMKSTASNWIGIYSGTSLTAPTSYSAYTWYCIKGEDGKDGQDGIDATYNTYTITFDYGKAKAMFEDAPTTKIIKSTEWLTTLPKIKDDYKNSFLGWFIAGTNKEISNYDFVGGNVALEARFDVEKGLSGLYQNGKYVKTWTDLKDEYPHVFKDDKITMNYTFVLSGELVVPGSIVQINSNAFKNSNLTRIILHSWIKNIEESAFMGCDSLTDMVIPNGVTSIGENAFSGCNSLTNLVIPNSVTSIGQRAFADCCYLGTIEIENGMKSISDGAFWGCGSRNIIIPNSVTTIGSNAFKECSNLKSISLPNSVISIGVYAFDRCSSLISITIPDSVTTISGPLFMGCSSLESVFVDEKNSVYDSRNNCNAIIETSTNTLLSGIKNTIIPNSVKIISSSAFNDCKGLTSITIPNGIETIGSYAFRDCSLTSVTIPESVTTIGTSAFDSDIQTIIIESPTVANGLIGNNSFGSLIDQGSLAFLKTVYIKTGLSVNNSTYLLNYFAKQTTTDKEGYDKYVYIHP